MKSIQQAMLEDLYTNATNLAREQKQVVGEKNAYYITLKQLGDLLAVYLE